MLLPKLRRKRYLQKTLKLEQFKNTEEFVEITLFSLANSIRKVCAMNNEKGESVR